MKTRVSVERCNSIPPDFRRRLVNDINIWVAVGEEGRGRKKLEITTQKAFELEGQQVKLIIGGACSATQKGRAAGISINRVDAP